MACRAARCSRRTAIAAVALTAALLGDVRAQGLAGGIDAALPPGPPRRTVVGRVEGVDRPLARAEVTLLGIPWAFDPGRDHADIVEVRADDEGRFRAAVLPGLPYCAFACGPADGGTTMQSALQGWFGAGAIVELRCVAAPTVRLRVRGLESWQAEPGCTLCAEFGWPGDGAGPVLRNLGGEVVDGFCTASWPAWPRGSVTLRGAGGRLWSHPVTAIGDAGVDIPRPRSLRCRVRDDRGAPIAGAAIRLRVGRFLDRGVDQVATTVATLECLLAHTGADGTAELRLPLADDPFDVHGQANVLFAARAAGCVERVSGFQGQSWIRDDRQIEPDSARELLFTLPASDAVRGEVVFTGSATGEGVRVRLLATGKIWSGPGAFAHDARTYEAAVGADGSFAIDCAPADPFVTQMVLLRPGAAPLPFAPQRGRPAPARLDLAATVRLALSVQDVRRGPASGHIVYLQRSQGGRQIGDLVCRCAVDGAGRGEVELCAGEWLASCIDADGFASARLTLAAGERADAKLLLRAHESCRGVLTDDRGQPVDGAQLRLESQSVRAGSDADVATLWQVVGPTFCRMVGAAVTAGDGSFAVPCPPLPEVVLSAHWIAAGRRSTTFELKAGAEPLPLRWQ